MQTGVAVALVGLAISFALAMFAQQKDTVDPKIEQRVRVLAAKFDDAINRHDAVAVAALFTQDGVGQISESKVSAGHRKSVCTLVQELAGPQLCLHG